MNDTFWWLAVQLVLWLSYVVVPYAALAMGRRCSSWPEGVVLAMVAGLCVQVLLGAAWSAWIRLPAVYEGAVYLLAWLLVGLVLRAQKSPSVLFPDEPPDGRWEHFVLLIGLLVGGMVRSLHPLRTPALGQSDAYSHLAMFRQVLEAGVLGNPVYPPGYAWIMAMPAALTGLDVYYVARFGGAFLGVAMALTLYFFLARGGGDVRAGLAGALLIAFFPGFVLLHKTGVGAFANQAGLFLLPLLFGSALLLSRPATRNAGLLVGLTALLTLLITVPMMLLHAGTVLGLFVLLFGCRSGVLTSRAACRWFGWLVCVLVLALALLVHGGGHALSVVALVLTTANEGLAAQAGADALGTWGALRLLITDFFTVKRWGSGVLLVDGVFAVLTVAYAVALGVGWRRCAPALIMLGCWGGLAAVQTATGWLQFTAYQREGWSLMLACAGLGGVSTAWCWSVLPRLRVIVVVGMLLAAVVAFMRPPAHVLTTSVAEEDLVRIARMLRAYPDVPSGDDPRMEEFAAFIRKRANLDEPLVIVTRPFLQEHLLSAVSGPNPGLVFSRRDSWRTFSRWIGESKQVLVMLDTYDDADWAQNGSFALVSPESARSFAEQQRASYSVNQTLEQFALQLSPDQWRVEHFMALPRLKVYWVNRL